MNKNEICDIIKDLLPGYIDGVLSEAGTKAVKEHLESCEACQQAYLEMKEGLEGEEEPKERLALDGLKKVRQRTRRLRLIAGTAAGLLVVVLLTFFIHIFVAGEPLSTSEISADEVVYNEETGCLEIKGTINLAATHISRVVWEESEEEENAVNVLVYGAESLPFRKDKREFTITIPNMKGKKAYLACPDYDQFQIYNWKYGHYDELDELEDEIYNHFPQLDRARDVLSYMGGVDTVNGKEGVSFWVDSVVGEDATFWWFNDQLVTDGDLEGKHFDVWISLEQPREILVYDYKTGEYKEELPLD